MEREPNTPTDFVIAHAERVVVHSGCAHPVLAKFVWRRPRCQERVAGSCLLEFKSHGLMYTLMELAWKTHWSNNIEI